MKRLRKSFFEAIELRKGRNEEWKKWLKELEEKENREKEKKQENK